MQNVFDLISVENRDGMIATTSLNISEVYGKRHDHVCRDIANKLEKLSRAMDRQHSPKLGNVPQAYVDWMQGTEFPRFVETTYTDSTGATNKMYLLNRNATVWLLMGYTGDKAFDFQMAYMFAFDKMLFERYMPSDLPNKRISNVNYDACDKLISEYKKALEKPSDTNSVAAAKLKGKILKLAVGFDPVEEYDKQRNFEAKVYNEKCIADMKAREAAQKEWEARKKQKATQEPNPYEGLEVDDSLYGDIPF